MTKFDFELSSGESQSGTELPIYDAVESSRKVILNVAPSSTFVLYHLKKNWDVFFKSISHSKSEVGNYIVKGGLFKSYNYAEKYYRSSIEEISNKLKSI